jgi:hypothetical protein
MRVAERATPVAAVIAALSTLACCLPFGFLGAVGLAGLSVWARSYAAWFLALAVVLLVLGFVQLYRGRGSAVWIIWAACRPLRFGILKSNITRSGIRIAVCSTAARPSSASPQTSQPFPSIRFLRARLEAAESSAMSRRGIRHLSFQNVAIRTARLRTRPSLIDSMRKSSVTSGEACIFRGIERGV